MKKLVSILIFLILATNTSCLKKQNLDEEDLGPAIEPQALSTAMLEGFGSLNYGAIAANEFSSYVLTQKIQDSYIDPIEQQDLTIESSTDTPEKLSMNLILTKIKYSSGQSSQSTRKWEQVFDKSPTLQSTEDSVKDFKEVPAKNFTETLTNILPSAFPGIVAKPLTLQNLKTFADNDPPTFLFIYFQSLAFGSCYDEGDYPETCHNLSVTDFRYKVPQTALAQHDCTDSSQCFINARRIEFDVIQKNVIDKDGKPRRIHYTLVLSKEVPYLSRMLQLCSRALYDMTNSNQKILADLCYNINNYSFGGTQK